MMLEDRRTTSREDAHIIFPAGMEVSHLVSEHHHELLRFQPPIDSVLSEIPEVFLLGFT